VIETVPLQSLTREERRFVQINDDPNLMAEHYPWLAPVLPGPPAGPTPVFSPVPTGPPGSVDVARTGGAPFIFSLNDGRSFAPPGKQPEIIDAFTLGVLPPGLSCGQSSGWEKDMDPARRRAAMELEFERLGYTVHSAPFWSWVDRFKPAVADVANIQNTPFQEFRRTNFLNCFKNFQRGNLQEMVHPGGATVHQVTKFSCGNRHCFWCGPRKRRSLAADYTRVIEECRDKFGLKKTWSFVFTVPESLEKSIGSRVVELRQGINKILKKAFGVKSRDALGMIITSHPVGSSDLMRDRFHFHVLVVPLVFKGTKLILSSRLDSINIPALRAAWFKVLGGSVQPINPEVKWHATDSEGSMARISHRLRYDLRSFAEDVESSIVGRAGDWSALVLKCSSGDEMYWRSVSFQDLATRWVWLRKNNKIQPYGFLNRLSALQEAGVFSVPEPPELVPVSDPVECSIEIVRRHVWDKKLGKLVWERKEFCHTESGSLEIGVNAHWA
jgi:hypothetical protein